MSALSDFLDNAGAVLRARWYLRNVTNVGIKARVWGRPVIKNKGIFEIGERFKLISTIATTELVAEYGGRLSIGSRVFINYGCSIGASQLVSIGDLCSIGQHAILLDSDYHRIEPERRHEAPDSAPIILEENVWLGARVIVLKGVTIGANSVVGAGSVVVKDIPPRCLAAGVPARVIRSIDEASTRQVVKAAGLQ